MTELPAPEELQRKLETLRDAHSMLVRAVEGYLDNPGCNNPAKATAMAKLRWAMEQSVQKAEGAR